MPHIQTISIEAALEMEGSNALAIRIPLTYIDIRFNSFVSVCLASTFSARGLSFFVDDGGDAFVDSGLYFRTFR
jgi:hypothetical protein